MNPRIPQQILFCSLADTEQMIHSVSRFKTSKIAPFYRFIQQIMLFKYQEDQIIYNAHDKSRSLPYFSRNDIRVHVLAFQHRKKTHIEKHIIGPIQIFKTIKKNKPGGRDVGRQGRQINVNQIFKFNFRMVFDKRFDKVYRVVPYSPVLGKLDHPHIKKNLHVSLIP